MRFSKYFQISLSVSPEEQSPPHQVSSIFCVVQSLAMNPKPDRLPINSPKDAIDCLYLKYTADPIPIHRKLCLELQPPRKPLSVRTLVPIRVSPIRHRGKCSRRDSGK